MPHRRLARVPVPPGAPGVAAVTAALRTALGGGPAFAPVPVTSTVVSDQVVGQLLSALRPDDDHCPLEDDDVAAVVATSGSTGDPRGVLLSAEALLAVARGRAGVDPLGAHYLVAVPVTSVGGLQVALRALLAGTDPVTLPSIGGGEPFTPSAFTAATRALSERAAGAPIRTSLVPAQLRRLLDDPASAEALPAYDQVLLGGAATTAGLLGAATAAGVRVVRTYGMTETAGGCVYDGIPLPGVTVTLEPVTRAGEDDAVGQVVLGGPVVARGYRCRPQETARRFVDGRFRTGDIGVREPDGRLSVTGRIDDVVSVRGVSVAVGAVEAAIAGLPDVEAAAVVAVDDGDDGARLVAYVVLPPGATADTEATAASVQRLRAGVRDALGRAAVPRDVRTLPALPELPGGKIDRPALRRHATGH